jgi:hypothetical protein
MLAFKQFIAPARILTIFFLSITFLSQAQTDYNLVSGFENAVLSKCKVVQENCKTTTQLKENDLSSLPLGIAPQGCNGTTIIVIDSAYWIEKNGWFYSAYASVVIPGTSKPIAFAAKNIGFNGGVLSGSSKMKLVLVSPQYIKVNENVTLELPADGHNYIEFDCDGFKAINLKGNFIFSDGLLKPDTDIAQGVKTVTASFEINTHDLNNIMATVNITPFRISGLDDVSFEVHNAVVDYSDIINPPGFIFPQGYQQTYGADITLWRGFYLQDLTVRVKGLSGDSTTNKKPFTISARNLIIDDLGVSGIFTATNLLPLKEGNADGWPFSVDKLSAKIELNRLTGGSLEGYVGIPFLGENPVGYSAMVEQENNNMNYRFAVAIPDSMVFETALSATVQLNKGSVIALEKRGNGRLIPSALLHGKITVGGKLNAKGLAFQNLGLTTAKPYVTRGEFSTIGVGQSKGVGSFPVQINDINLKIYQGEVALGFGLTLNFMNKEDSPFGGSTHLEILAAMEEKQYTVDGDDGRPSYTKTKHEWKFKKVRVRDISIDVKTQAFVLKGSLTLYDDDPVYGTGFHGNVAFAIKKVLEKGIKVNAYFGSKDDFRYWHIDAYVPVGQIPIFPPVLLTGIMGGASYKMVRQQPLQPDFSQLGDSETAKPAKQEEYLVYIPDGNAGLGFLAGVSLVVANDNAINADVMFEVQFNKGGGLKYIRFDGSAFFLTPTKARGRVSGGEAPKATILAQMSMLFDNDNDVFHSNLKTYINLAGIITGVGPNGLVGEAVIHVDRSNWYTYIGRPSSMFGINILGLATAQTYFMVGTKVDNLPLPPSEVREIFGDIDLSLMRDDLAASGGKGFAAGVHFRIGFDSKDRFRPFYVMMAVGAGTDIMLRNYGNAQCVGRDGKLGINGWYASGQAYVFLTGKVGLRVKKKSFDIVSLGLAALLQANLPNPAWMRGMLAGKYSVLGGLVKGKFNLKFEIGEQCELLQQGAEVADIVVIADIKPDANGTDVNVFTAPQVSFNTSIGQDFSMADLQNNVNSYRIALDEFTLMKDGTKIPGTIQWNATSDVAILKTAEILPPQSKLHVAVKIHWEKKSGNGMWEAVHDNDNVVIYETKETNFTTGTAPDFIPEENVTYSYPINYQHNLYINESGAGYVKLNYGQEYLFRKTEGTTSWDFIARFKDNKGKINEVPLTYDVAQAKASFNFPTLEKQAIYTITFIKKPQSSGAVDQNVQRQQVTVDAGEGNEMTTNSNTLEGTVTQNVEKEIYASAFRASQFSTFSEKWAALGNGQDAFDVAKGNVAVIGKRMNAQESFDEYELVGKEGMAPLVQVAASPNNTWLKNTISPLLYDLYPYDKDITIDWRNPDVLGVKPLKGVKLTNSIDVFKLTDSNVTAGRVPATSGSVLIGYYLSYYVFWDYNDLLNKASAKYLNDWNSRPAGVKRLMVDAGYTDLLEGSYPVDIKYTLPGADKPNFTTQVSIKF